MNPKIALIALIVMLTAGVGGWYFGKTSEENRYRVETPVGVEEVEFSLPDMDGVTRESSEWAGKARLINFWATWCAPCRREIPLLKATQDAHGADNVQVIGIAVDFHDEVNAYNEEAQFNYPVLIGQDDAMAVAERSGVPFIGLPFTMVIAPSGELIKAHVGEIVESHIEEIIHVFEQMENGSLDADGAREALGDL